MENIQKQKVGAGILTISIIHFVMNGIGLLGLLAAIAMKDAINEAAKTQITTSVLVISLVFIAIITLAVILILMKKSIGIYIYFIVQGINIVYAIVVNGFSPMQIISIVLPVLMGIFVWKKKEVFGLGAKAENISL
ncbi:hypothetical protein [Clostridium sp.]|uniref:hypothetical protein n=1 Tax=Clostridium sp. TaxID=1506 RepID=UPI003D6CC359